MTEHIHMVERTVVEIRCGACTDGKHRRVIGRVTTIPGGSYRFRRPQRRVLWDFRVGGMGKKWVDRADAGAPFGWGTPDFYCPDHGKGIVKPAEVLEAIAAFNDPRNLNRVQRIQTHID
jgi:hypothetical protein